MVVNTQGRRSSGKASKSGRRAQGGRRGGGRAPGPAGLQAGVTAGQRVIVRPGMRVVGFFLNGAFSDFHHEPGQVVSVTEHGAFVRPDDNGGPEGCGRFPGGLYSVLLAHLVLDVGGPTHSAA